MSHGGRRGFGRALDFQTLSPLFQTLVSTPLRHDLLCSFNQNLLVAQEGGERVHTGDLVRLFRVGSLSGRVDRGAGGATLLSGMGPQFPWPGEGSPFLILCPPSWKLGRIHWPWPCPLWPRPRTLPYCQVLQPLLCHSGNFPYTFLFLLHLLFVAVFLTWGPTPGMVHLENAALQN